MRGEKLARPARLNAKISSPDLSMFGGYFARFIVLYVYIGYICSCVCANIYIYAYVFACIACTYTYIRTCNFEIECCNDLRALD